MHSKLEQAAHLHNKALLYKKKTLQQQQQQLPLSSSSSCSPWSSSPLVQQPLPQPLQQDCLEAIYYYQKALQLYQECHLEYRHSSSSSNSNNRSNSNNSEQTQTANTIHHHHQQQQQQQSEKETLTTIHLELKIAQTYQSLAKMYRILQEEEHVIQAHEDVLCFLLQEQQRQSEEDMGEEGEEKKRNKYMATTADGTSTPANATNNATTTTSSPTSVTDIANGNIFSSKYTMESVFCLVPLTMAERTRIMSFSLNALGHLYFVQECESTSNSSSEGTKNDHGDDHAQPVPLPPPPTTQDALKYYQNSLNLLLAVGDNHVVCTRIASLGHYSQRRGDSRVYWMDLKRDILSTLWEMARVRQYRREYMDQINILSEARDWIRWMMGCMKKDGVAGVGGGMEMTSSCSSSSSSSSSCSSFVRHMEEMVESELARTYVRVKDWNNAHLSYQHVLGLRKDMFGEDSLEVGHVYQSLSDLNRQMGDLGQSLGWNKRAVEIYMGQMGECGSGSNGGGKYLVGSLQHQGALYVQMREVEKAIEIYWKVLEEQVKLGKKAGGEMEQKHDNGAASTWSVLGHLYKSKKRWKEAKHCYQMALESWNSGSNYDRKKKTEERRKQRNLPKSKRGDSFQVEEGQMVEDADSNVVSVLESLCQVEKIMQEKKGSEEQTSRQVYLNNEMKERGNNMENENHGVHGQQHQQESTSFSSPPSHLPFRPPIVPSSIRQKEGDDALQKKGNVYCKVVETRPVLYLDNGDHDDDAVSQITFLTSQLEAPSTSGLTYKTLEERLEDWSPAEYVFQAVDKIANATEEFAQDFFSVARKYNKKADKRRITRRGHAKRLMGSNNDLESQQSDGQECDVREVICRETNSAPTNTINMMEKTVKSPVYGMKSETSSMQSIHLSNSVESSATSAPQIELSHDTDKMMGNDVGNESSSTSKLEDMSFVNADDSVAASTVFGSLLGTNFVSDGSIGATTQTSTLYGAKFIDNESISKPGMHSDKTHSTKRSTSSSTLDMDELMAQLNVVTCDTEDTRTFEEVLKSESHDEVKQARARSRRNKTFEKISACLGALDELVDEYGPEHAKVIEKLVTLAALYLDVGNVDKGLLKYRQVLDLQKKKYGKYSSQVCSTYVKLGNYFAKEEEHVKAIEHLMLAIEIEKRLHGGDHPKVAHLLNSMGTVELDRNEYDQAMDYFQSALQIQQMYLGPNEINPDLSLTYANIGSVYYKEQNEPNGGKRTNLYNNFIEAGLLGKIAFAHSERGEYMKAMHFYSEVLEHQKQRDEPIMNVVGTYCCLAELNVKIGHYAEALEHYHLSLRLLENSKTLKDLNVCTITSDIAVVECHLGNFETATQSLESAFATQRKSLGKHPRVAKTMYHIGVIKRLQYQKKSALSFLNGSLKIQLSTIGQYHPDTILTQVEIAKVLFDWYEFDESIRKLTTVLRMQYDLLGHVHPDIAGTLHLLGVCFSKMKNQKLAMKYFEKCYRMQLKVLDFDCPAVASTKDEIGSIFVQQGKLDKASQLIEDSLRIRRKIGEDHFEVAFSLYNMGHYSIARSKYSDALKYFEDASVIAIRAFGPEHPFVGDIHVGLGTVNTRQCYFEEAKRDFQAALKIYETCKLSKNHQRVVNCQEGLKRATHQEDLCV